MNEILIFNNPEFGQVRTVEVNGEPYFVGKDICMAFGDKNHNRSLGRVSDDDKVVVEITDSMGRKQSITAINESGLYSLLFAMQPQKANNGGVLDAYPIEVQQRIDKLHKFKHWVTHEVLPSIRKTGGYSLNQKPDSYMIDDPIERAKRWIEEAEERKALAAKVEENKPLVVFANSVETAKTSILIGDLAKILKQNGVDIGRKRLFAWLRDNGYLMKGNSTSKNMPTQRSMEAGLFEIKEGTFNNPDGTIGITKTPKVTGKGQIYFINKFLGKGNEEVKS